MQSHGLVSSDLTSLSETDLHANFQAGDLLYGLAEIRALHAHILAEKFKAKVTVDEYNNPLFAHLREPGATDLADITPGDKRYLAELDRVPIAKYRRGAELRAKSDGLFEDEDRILRHACKATLLRTDITKHFLLDGIHPRDVLDKNYSYQNIKPSSLYPLFHSFTSAELHFIFKNFHLMDNKVVFYLDGKKTTLFDWLKDTNTLDLFYDYIASKSANESLRALSLHQCLPASMAEYRCASSVQVTTPPSSPSKRSGVILPGIVADRTPSPRGAHAFFQHNNQDIKKKKKDAQAGRRQKRFTDDESEQENQVNFSLSKRYVGV